MRSIWPWAPTGALLCWASTLLAQSPGAAPAPAAPVPNTSPTPAPLPEEEPVPSGANEPAPLDQGPDTLPSLDEEAPPALSPPPKPKVVSVGARRARRPIRAERRLALLGELGWNGLAGFGPNLVFHADPHLSFELGVGLAAIGAKVGLRARYNLLEGAVTPFFGVGVLGGSGFDAPPQQDPDTELNIQLRPSAFFQSVVGIDWTRSNGFTLVGALGYAWLLTGDNVEIITGVPTEEERRGLEVVFGSSIVISIAIGYSFR
jgi:hypothetical protein